MTDQPLNLEAIDDAIRVMERVSAKGYRFDMGTFGQLDAAPDAPVVEDLRRALYEGDDAAAASCGTAACFVGWFAMSSEGRKHGLHAQLMIHPFDRVSLRVWSTEPDGVAEYALQDVFRCKTSCARKLAGLFDDYYPEPEPGYEVTPEDVIDALRCLRGLGELGLTLADDLERLEAKS